ncbi:MAG: hypothetical protein JWO09_313 [Bacteroidetes bacterium]|nr:hypothetical protein [Bacteroidota bacterium]
MKKLYSSVIVLLTVVCSAFAQSSAKYTELTREAKGLFDNKQYKRSAETYTKAFRANGWKAYRADRYNAACAWTLAGNKDSAFYQLFKVADAFKYDNYDRISTDSVLISLNKDARWDQLLNIVKQNIGKDEAKLNKALLKLMDSVYHDDQAYRFQQISVDKEFGASSPEGKNIRKVIHEKDSINEIIVSGLLDKYGWIGKEVVGSNGNTTLGLVLQHSSLATQLKYLPVMREAVKTGKADPYDLAMLEDLVLVRQGEKQLYGSSIVSVEGKYYVSPMEDPANVDKRRAKLGLGTLDEYLRNWGIRWDLKKYEEDLKLYGK